MSKKETKKTLPSVEDKRDKTKKSDSITISNYKNLDPISDKKKIDKLIKEKQDALKNPYYSIDLNTKKVKQNDRVSFIVNATKSKYRTQKGTNKDIYKLVSQDYINQMTQFNNGIDEYLDKEYKDIQDLKDNVYSFNNIYDTNYRNGFNIRVRNYLDDAVKQDYLNKYSDAVASTQYLEIKDKTNSIKDFINSDIETLDFYMLLEIKQLKDIQQQFKDKYNDASDAEMLLFDLIKECVYKDELESVDAEIKENLDFYKEVKSLYETIDNKILKIVDNFVKYYEKLEDTKLKNYDIVKFDTNNDIVSKIDPIAKNILSGKNYEIGKLIKTDNNYNDKSYGAVFSIKTADLSNIDIIQELQQKGIQINHFGKKIIDDVDILLDENKGNVNNNDKLVALTPKMIARKVYNKEQPTKNQIKEIESYLRYLSNIYLFFVKDDATALNVEKLVQLKDRGLEFLQDEEGNVLNIGDALDDNIILNAKYGYSKKYNSIVYVFDNKSIFERVNQLINNDIGKQLKLSLKDKADLIFNDNNKYVNNEIVGIRYFLLERVNQIKHITENNNTNKEILLKNIYDEYNITTPKQKGAIRKAIKNTLNHWVDINFIVSYKFLDKEGNKIPINSTKEIYKIYLNVSSNKADNTE